MNVVYPWQENQWQHLTKRMHAKTFPHALMLAGPEGIGKHDFASALTNALVCTQPLVTGLACGDCKHCLLMHAHTFPDFVHLSLQKDKNTISVDEIRELISKLYLTRHFDTYKVALIDCADQMNTSAANALLKTLEEPPESTVIILVTSHALSLPATIRSRCQLVEFYPPSENQAIDWLKNMAHDVEWEPLLRVAQGAPLQAIQFHETELLDQRISVVQGFLEIFESNANPMSIAARIEAIPFAMCFQWIQAVIADLLRIKATENPITLENPDFYRPLLALSPRMQVPLLLEFWELLIERKKLFDNSLNRKLFTESLLIRVHKLALKYNV